MVLTEKDVIRAHARDELGIGAPHHPGIAEPARTLATQLTQLPAVLPQAAAASRRGYVTRAYAAPNRIP